MKKQLTSALKKSISAEQKEVAQKKPAVKATETANPTTKNEDAEVRKVITNIKKTTVQKPAQTKSVATAKKPAETKSVETPVIAAPQVVQSNSTHSFFSENFSTSFPALKNLSAISEKSQELADTTLEAVTELNKDIFDYITSCTQIRDISELMKLNVALITQLTTRQKQFIEDTMSILKDK